MIPRPAAWCCAAALAGCAHSEPGSFTPAHAGPRTGGAMIQLTYNAGQNYWPTWTSDAQGILYAFVPPGATAYHRCIGLLPAGGGTDIWQLCDNRATEVDTAISYSAYALDQQGRLLYAEVVAPLIRDVVPTQGQRTPTRTTLWLADSARPFERTALIDFPVIADVTWLGDLAWTGNQTFIALRQSFSIAPIPPRPCNFEADSIFSPGAVVTGTIAGAGATLQSIAGTDGATGYSLADHGASVVFIRSHDPRLFKVPVTGGAPTTVATVSLSGTELVGVSCNDVSCVVAASAVILSGGSLCPGSEPAPNRLFAVDLATGEADSVATASELFNTPLIAPTGGNVIAGIGGNMGHLQTYAAADIEHLYLYPGLIQ